MTTGSEPFTASIEKEANTSSNPNITFVAELNTHSTEEPLNVTSKLNPTDHAGIHPKSHGTLIWKKHTRAKSWGKPL
ncbi:hypothetical protein Tco_0495357 [Tanacetum coccineum]